MLFLFWTLFLWSNHLAASQGQTVISAESGHDVSLPCRAEHSGDITAVEWTRPDLGSEYVGLFRNKQLDPENQHPSFQNRVDLQDRQMKDGDVSLILKNLTTKDTGTYKCKVTQRQIDGKNIESFFINLNVSPPPPGPFPSWATALLVLLVLVLIVSAGVLYHFRFYFMSVYKVEVEEGVESVLLPCRTIVHLPGDARVEWKDDYRTVHVYQNGSDQLEDQDQVYKTRTVMERNPLQSGDLSLTLKHPTDGDSKTFTCSVYSREGNILMKKQVNLTVRVPQVEVKSGAESVLLPFRTTVHLPGDAKVEWKDGNRKVHVYQNGSDQLEDQDQVYRTRTVMERNPLQSGNLSLTLKHPTDEDSSIFTCRVYSREGKILIKKQIRLTVRVPQVEVESGAESVLLPCRATVHLPGDAKVEWKDGNRKVHVYQNGSDQLEDQDQIYRTRTVMERNPLRSGNLSLTLKLPTDEDSSIFTCIVYNKEGNILMKKQVRLTVRVPQVEVGSEVESVLLPCRTTVHLPGDAKVEWKSYYGTVHVYQNGSDQLEDQDQVDKTRTVMERNPLQSGDLSLTLKHPTHEDSSIFTCIVYSREGNILMKKQVLLTVRVQQVKVEVESGVESVLLPCRTTDHLPGDARVVWKVGYRTVHVYQNGSDQPEDQDQVYKTRTVMERNPLQSGDLSLTLKHPTHGDSWIFTCIVYNRKGNILMKKRVRLKVRACQVEVEEGAESVLLPFRTTPDLPGDAKVEWKDGYRTVHVYQNGSDQLEDQDQVYKDRTVMERNPLQSGNLSLTLKHPKDEDSNIFTCSVYSREGNILMKKQIRLTVRVPQVEEGVKSVLLPFRTKPDRPGDARVEWKDNYTMVHEYQNGSDQLEVRVWQVEVEEGAESVLLPFRTTVHLPGDARVEWKDINDRNVHVFQTGSDQPGEQFQVYRNRTKMNQDPVKTGDLSLSLDHPKPGDSGWYRCVVWRRGNFMRSTTFELKVKGTVRVQDQTEDIRTRNGTNDPLMADESV